MIKLIGYTTQTFAPLFIVYLEKIILKQKLREKERKRRERERRRDGINTK